MERESVHPAHHGHLDAILGRKRCPREEVQPVSLTKQVITWGKENGYRLAFPTEREAFSKANRDLQRLFSIMDLGSFVHDDDYRLVPVLHELEGERYLGHGSLDDGSEHRFVFITHLARVRPSRTHLE